MIDTKTTPPLTLWLLAALALSLLAVFGATRFDQPALATHGGMDTMAIDMDSAGNSSSAIGSIQQCARINKNGSLDADEDVIDGVIIDVTAQNIPTYNNNGTADPSDDAGGIIGYQYTLNYPSSQFTVDAQQAKTSAVNILAANNTDPTNSILIASEPLPDDNLNNWWDSAALDGAGSVPDGDPESGSGVIDRLTIKADSGLGVVPGQYLLSLSSNAHIDSANSTLVPHTTTVANIAVGQACGTLVTSYGYYHPVTPARVLDTRSFPQGVPAGKVQQNAEITVDVTGVGGVPTTADVSAVVLNVTVTEPSGGYLTIFPSGTTRPLASNLNFVAGQTIPNLVTVKVGADGNVKVYNCCGQTHVIFDVVGWYGGSAGGSLFNALAPARVLDTRSGPQGQPAGIVQQNSTTLVTVKGVGGVPNTSDVTAVVVNTTVTDPTSVGYLTVYPSDQVSPPLASNLNFTAGLTIPNLVIVRVGSVDGKIKVYNCCGQTHVVMDVVGYYSSSSGVVFNSLNPARILDTRTSPQGTPPGKVGQASPVTASVTGTGGVPAIGSGVTAAVINTTVTEPTSGSYLTVYPSDVGSPPLASNLNFSVGQTIPNLVMVKVGAADGKVKIFNCCGQVHVVFDVVGYFAPVP